MKLLRQAWKYLRASLRWWRAGSPTRPAAEVKRIFYEHCAPCGHRDPRTGECTLCECSVSPNSDERNKIVFKTESCPDEKW